MKEQIQLINFTCDNCRKILKNQLDFPYSKGWVYLFRIELKPSKSQRVIDQDKHFCSKKCLKEILVKCIDKKPIEERK